MRSGRRQWRRYRRQIPGRLVACKSAVVRLGTVGVRLPELDVKVYHLEKPYGPKIAPFDIHGETGCKPRRLSLQGNNTLSLRTVNGKT